MSAPNKSKRNRRSHPMKGKTFYAVQIVLGSEEPATKALDKMSAQWPLKTKDKLYRRQQMARRLLLLALAHVEIIAPRFESAIDYSEAEGLQQEDYLDSLIRTKFAKGLHIDRDDDDDDDDDDPASPAPQPIGTPSAATT